MNIRAGLEWYILQTHNTFFRRFNGEFEPPYPSPFWVRQWSAWKWTLVDLLQHGLTCTYNAWAGSVIALVFLRNFGCPVHCISYVARRVFHCFACTQIFIVAWHYYVIFYANIVMNKDEYQLYAWLHPDRQPAHLIATDMVISGPRQGVRWIKSGLGEFGATPSYLLPL